MSGRFAAGEIVIVSSGLAGLEDRLLRPSLHRASRPEIERMLGLYRDLYRGYTVKHFHEQLGKTARLHAGYTALVQKMRSDRLCWRAEPDEDPQ